MNRFGYVVLAELDKLRTLPTTGATLLGVVLAAVALRQVTVHDPGLYLQPGLVVMGLLPITHEYAGRQLRTSLTAVPSRGLLLAGKTTAALAAVLLTATLGGERFAYLARVGMLAYVVALLLRHLIPALTTTLTLVLLLPPLLATHPEITRWLPTTTPQAGLAWIVIVGSLAAYRFHRRD